MRKVLFYELDGVKNDIYIRKANELGYETVFCSNEPLPSNVNVDKFYQIDTNNIDEVVALAKKENVDGLICTGGKWIYNSAIIAKKLGLPCSNVDGIDIMRDKGRFRECQEKLGIFYPKSFLLDNEDDLVEKAKSFRYPIIMKPDLSSGSRGTTRIDSFDEKEIRNTFKLCSDFSRNSEVVIEEFVEPKKPYQILEGDIYVFNGKIWWEGLRYCYRFPDAPFLPSLDVYDVKLNEKQERVMKDYISKIIDYCGFTIGQINFEGSFTKDDDFFIIEMNPRPAGCNNPLFVSLYSGIDFIKLLDTTFAGDMSYYEELKSFVPCKKSSASFIVYSHESGTLKHLYIDDEIKEYIKWSEDLVHPGEPVAKASSSFDKIANIYLDFGNDETRDKYVYNIRDYIYPILK